MRKYWLSKPIFNSDLLHGTVHHIRPIAEIHKELERYRRSSDLLQVYPPKFYKVPWNAQKLAQNGHLR